MKTLKENLDIYPEKSHDAIQDYYYVEFYDDNGRCKNHWLSYEQTYYFKNREDAIKFIKEVESWNAISFTQTLIRKVN